MSNLKEKIDLKKETTFKIGCNASDVYVPENLEEFMTCLRELDDFKILGAGSNVLISSLEIGFPVILTKKLNNFSIAENKIIAQTGVKTAFLAQQALAHQLSGMEFLSCIPASIGGVVYMNASAHSQSIADILTEVTAFNLTTQKPVILSKDKLDLSYRHSIFQDEKMVILGATFEMKPLYREVIEHKMEQNKEYRTERHPSMKTPNAGSIFKNPEGESAGMLIESVGLKGYSVGGAKVSEKHANFVVNVDNATSMDVLNLMLVVQDEVFKKSGHKLRPEVEYIGKNKEEVQIWQKLNS